jgi:uncharacterized membrane protein
MEISTRSAVRFGWETFKRRPWFFIGSTLVIGIAYSVVEGLTSAIDAAATGSADEPSLLGTSLNLAASTLISMGATSFYLAAHDAPDTVDLSPLWHPRPFWKFLGTSLLVGLAVIVGLILLIVPGIIFAMMFMFATFVVIDRELGPINAMNESARIAKGYKWQLLGFIVVLALLNLLGLIALVVGLLVTVPVTSLAFTHVYRALSERAGAKPALPDASLAPTA